VQELSEKYHLSPNSHVYANLVRRFFAGEFCLNINPLDLTFLEKM
jgi:hypothetical protein